VQALAEDDLARVEIARKVVSDLVAARLGETAASSIDLNVLQEILDRGAIAPDETYKLQCMGIVFGDLLCARSRFEWRMIDDEYGRDPTLAYPGRALNLNVLTIIAKRVENGDEVDLASMAEWALERAETAEATEIH
jgi:hypothetical protein